MFVEIFFEVNGGDEEQRAVCLKISAFLNKLQEKGDIAKLDSNIEKEK